MQNSVETKVQRILVPICVAILATLMILPNLDRSYLWQDEAQHALLSRTILTHGVPMGRDGLNSTSQEQGKDIGPDGTFRYHPWLPFYMSAASFAMLGQTTWAARIPFALIGIATVVATYFLALTLWRNRATAVIAAGLLGFSVPYLLLARQCRYYSPLAFFLLLGVWVYVEVVRGKKWAPYALAVVATLLMHTLHLYSLVFLAAAVLHMAIWERALWKQVLIPTVIVGAIHVPWFMWISAGATYSHPSSFAQMIDYALVFGWRMLVHITTPVLILAGIGLAIKRKRAGLPLLALDREQRAGVYLIGLLVIIGLGLLSARAPFHFFRYLSAYPPLVAILGAPILVATFRARREVGTLVTIALGLWYFFPMSLGRYPAELLQPHNGPIRGIVEYLREHAEPGDVVFIAYGDLPVAFYLPHLRVYGPGLAEETLREAWNADWCIPRRVSPMGKGSPTSDMMKSIITKSKFQLIQLNSPDLAFENREDLREHYFTTPKGIPPVHVLRRVAQ